MKYLCVVKSRTVLFAMDLETIDFELFPCTMVHVQKVQLI